MKVFYHFILMQNLSEYKYFVDSNAYGKIDCYFVFTKKTVMTKF